MRDRTSSGIRRILLTVPALLLGAALAVGAPLAASADDPVDLAGAYIVDTVGALGGREADVQSALDELTADTDVQMFVVFVDSFDGIATDESWAVTTAERNRLGTDDILFAVATVDRNYEVRYADDFRLGVDETTAVERLAEEQLREDDWAGAAITAANGYRASLTGAALPDSTEGQTTEASASPLPLIVVIVLLIAVVAVVAVLLLRRRRGAQNSPARPIDGAQVDQKTLDQRVGTLLVQVDDSLRTSEQELGFAIAQYGDEAAAPFSAALVAAKKNVADAFRLKQQLDDATPDSPEDRRAKSLEIIELCEQADAALDKEADAFDDLRALEKNAPAELVRIRADRASLAARVAPATAELAALATRYPPAALAPVAANPSKAQELLELVETSAVAGDRAVSLGDTPRAAVAVTAARSALGQATQLLAAIDAAGEQLEAARAKLAALLADTRQDLAAARNLPAASSSTLDAAIAAAETAVAAEEADPTGDPVARLTRLTDANTALDRAVGPARDAAERLDRARASLDSTLATALSQITVAGDFITTRRGAVGDGARTRLSEAMRHLDLAVSQAVSDPVAALSEAQQASALAVSATELASTDIDAYSSGRGGAARGGQADLGGLLGGLAAGILLGGNRGGGFGGFGGGFGGGSGGFGGGFGGGSRSSGSRSSGSRSGGFGGSGRSGGSRSSGGRF